MYSSADLSFLTGPFKVRGTLLRIEQMFGNIELQAGRQRDSRGDEMTVLFRERSDLHGQDIYLY